MVLLNMSEKLFFPMGAENAVQEKTELFVETRELFDANGERIAILEAAYDPALVETYTRTLRSNEPGFGRRLRELRLRHGGETIDVLELSNAKKHRAEVLVSAEDMESYYCSHLGPATSPPLRNAVDIATLLHELGHADQQRTERYGKILHRPPVSVQELNEMLAMFPGMRGRIPESEIAACRRLMTEWEALKQTKRELASAYGKSLNQDGAADREERISAVEALYQAAEKRVEEMERELIERFPDILLLRMRALEYDATRRALRWLHEMKKKGIDLLGPSHVSMTTSEMYEIVKARESGHEPGPCEASIRSALGGMVEVSPEKELEAALETYGATKQNLRETYQGGIPTPHKKGKT